MELSWRVEHESGVSLVRCRVRNDAAVPRRVRLRSLLEGPVLPPRRGGVPEAGWDAEGVTLRLDPGERRAIGFASPAPVAEPPVEYDAERIDEETGDEPGAKAAVRSLDSHRPPRDAVVRELVPESDDGSAANCDDESTTNCDGGSAVRSVGEFAGGPVEESTAEPDGDTAAEPRGDGVDEPRGDGPGDVGDRRDTESIGAWLDAVERRIERGERLVDADVETATEVLDRAGGIDAIEGLDAEIGADAERLRRLEERIGTLAARAERADVPMDALRRLS